MPSEAFQARYRIREELGRGSMGIVYRAEQVELQREVAVKFPTLGRKGLSERFVREAKILAGIAHPNVVKLFDAGFDEGEPYVVLELLQGPTLADVLAQHGPLPVRLAVGFTCQVLEGLQRAHDLGVVHRDVKPDNVIVAGRGVAKLADFGLARHAGGESLTAVGTLMGTPAYMAPEYVQGAPASPATDVYSAAVMLFQLLTGRVPFLAGDPTTMMTAQVMSEPPPPSSLREGLPPGLEEVVMQGLAKKPEERFGRAADFCLRLRSFIGDASLSAITLGELDVAALRRELNAPTHRMAKAGVIALLIGVAVMAWLCVRLWMSYPNTTYGAS